jgi:hypothetical protein
MDGASPGSAVSEQYAHDHHHQIQKALKNTLKKSRKP